jgi:hypothetical protein
VYSVDGDRDKLTFTMKCGIVVDTNSEQWPTTKAITKTQIAREQPVLEYGRKSRSL